MNKSQATHQLEQLLSYSTEPKKSPRISSMLSVSFISTMQDENAAEAIVSYTNRLLSVAASRHNGLLILNNILLQCPSVLVRDNASLWINYLVSCSPNEPVDSLRFNILVKIMEMCGGTPDFNKMMTNLLLKIIDMCLSTSLKANSCENALECLKTCLQKYPSACGPYRNKVELYLHKVLCWELPASIVKEAGSVFHFLQQVGGSGPEGITFKNNWSSQFDKLCSTMHKLYDEFLTNVAEFSSYRSRNVAPLDFYESTFGGCGDGSSDSDNSVVYVTASRLKNVMQFISCMLLERFPVEKNIAVSSIMDVIKRGLLVDVFQRHDESVESMQFAALLYTHQIELLYLLRSLIACLKQNLMPFSFTITKLLTDCQQRTQKEYFKSSCDYQKAVYKVLSYWITVAENKLSLTMHNKLMSLITSDITPIKSNVVVLSLNDSISKKKSAAAKRKAIQEKIISVGNDKEVSRTPKFIQVKQELCLEALNTCNTLLQYVILDLDVVTYMNFFQTVVHHLVNIQGGKAVLPYTSSKCQAGLYEVLASIFMQPSYCVTPFLQTAIGLFVKGQSRSISSNDEIFLACNKGLNLLEKLCQATCPTLHISGIIDSDTARSNKRKKSDFEEDELLSHLHTNHTANEYSAHTDTLSYMADSPQTCFSSTSSKRINIIDVQILKQGGDSGVGSSNDNCGNSVPSEHHTEEMDTCAAEQHASEVMQPIITNVGCERVGTNRGSVPEQKLKDVIIKTENYDEQPSTSNAADQGLSDSKVGADKNVATIKTVPPFIKALKESPKQSNSMDEEEMLASFNDIVNEY